MFLLVLFFAPKKRTNPFASFRKEETIHLFGSFSAPEQRTEKGL
jgi:hypothetical protein